MQKARIIVGAIVLAVVASLATFAATSPASAAKRDLVVVINEAEATVTPADFFSNLAPNQQASEDAPVYRDGEPVGLAETLITITRVEGDDIAALIECSIELPEGNLFFNGSAHFADLGTGVDLPVVGGTGEYERYTGVVTLVGSEDGTETTLTFHLRKP